VSECVELLLEIQERVVLTTDNPKDFPRYVPPLSTRPQQQSTDNNNNNNNSQHEWSDCLADDCLADGVEQLEPKERLFGRWSGAIVWPLRSEDGLANGFANGVEQNWSSI
jgi:hypothetical protein